MSYRGPVDRPDVVQRIIAWYAAQARDLPWRRRGVTAWGVMVSEFMLQQTPVSRVLAPWQAWLERWPAPADLAAEQVGEAIRAWGRLGYPRRAQRLHQTSVALVRDHGGEVPSDVADLKALPGIGEYTAAAIASFAFGRRHAVLATNVRRVLARIDGGQEQAPPTLSAGERVRADVWLPEDPARAALWAAASMELGAQVCLAATPRCHECPVADTCRWRLAGQPVWTGPTRPGQAYAGTDRQCRGVLLAHLRTQSAPVLEDVLYDLWPVDAVQARRALASLVVDGLVRRSADGGYRL